MIAMNFCVSFRWFPNKMRQKLYLWQMRANVEQHLKLYIIRIGSHYYDTQCNVLLLAVYIYVCVYENIYCGTSKMVMALN